MAERLTQLSNISQLIASHPSLNIGGENTLTNETYCKGIAKDSVEYGQKGFWESYAVSTLQARDTDDFSSRLETLNWHLKMRTFISGRDVTIDDVAVWVSLTLSPFWLPIYGTNKRIAIKNIVRWYRYLELLESFQTSQGKFEKQTNSEQAVMMEELEGAEMGKVVTRFPPEPSGYLHIGHAKACLLNSYYAKRYQGKMVLRFDDTNPKKSKEEYRINILKDMAALGVTYDSMTYTSDYFALLIEYAEKMITAGLAFVDVSSQDEITRLRGLLEPSACRDDSLEVNFQRWEKMKQATDEGKTYCLRAKIDYKNVNGTMRDPVIYRCAPEKHYRTGNDFNVYPTYNFACPIIDGIEGVTHALRSNEYHSSEEQYYWFLKNIPDLSFRGVRIKDFSRISFGYTVMSKRKLQWFVDEGHVDSWTDPRFPTIQGMMRRGLSMEALKRFILSQGDSKKGVNMDINMLWALNKQIIDQKIPRFTSIRSDNIVPITITGMATETEQIEVPRHKLDESLGKKIVTRANKIYIDQEDAKAIVDGEEITLMNWGNCIINTVTKENGVVVSCTGTLNLAGDFKNTKKKLTWLPAVESAPLVNVDLVEYDTLVIEKDIPKDKEFKDFVNPKSKYVTPGFADANVTSLQIGDKLQFERLGYFILDAVSEDKKHYTFVQFPDGHDKNLFLSCKVQVRK